MRKMVYNCLKENKVVKTVLTYNEAKEWKAKGESFTTKVTLLPTSAKTEGIIAQER